MKTQISIIKSVAIAMTLTALLIAMPCKPLRGPISLSANEYSAAKRLGKNYWLYVVFNCASSPEILAIQDPARLNWKPLSKIEQYQVGASELFKTGAVKVNPANSGYK